jgi:hypothetical protein
MSRPPVSYRDSGVDIDAGNALVKAIKPLAAATRRPGADADLGGFGGLFDLRRAGFKDPILVAANDGVGTKLRIAIESGRHETVGIDLVAMSVNDLLAQGAEPLFFLDYSPVENSTWTWRARWWPASPRAAARPAARSSVARPPRCRACTPAATTTSPASPSAPWSGASCCRAPTSLRATC